MKQYITVLTCLLLLLAACDGMNDNIQEYLDRGEVNYVGRPDSARTFGGVGRINIQWLVNDDPRIEGATIFWTDRQNKPQSADFTIDRNQLQNGYASVVINLEESSYAFKIVHTGTKGYASIATEVTGNVYGETYGSTLKLQPVESFAGNNGWYIFMGNIDDDNAIATEIEYSEPDGTVKTILIPISTKDTVIFGSKPQTTFRHRTLYMQDIFMEPVPSSYEEADATQTRVRTVDVVTKFGNGYAIALGTVERLSYSDIFYKNGQGEEVSLRVPASEPAAYLYDYDGSGFSQKACYIPSGQELDIFSTEKIPYTGKVGDVSVTITSSSPAIFKSGHFDLGGEGVGFHDSNASHDPGSGGANFRKNLGDYLSNAMDIESDAGVIGYTNNGEWLMYTVDVRDEGDYEIDWYISVNGGGAACHVEVDGISSDVYDLVNNSNWSDWR
jgi:hypothetical protein